MGLFVFRSAGNTQSSHQLLRTFFAGFMILASFKITLVIVFLILRFLLKTVHFGVKHLYYGSLTTSVIYSASQGHSPFCDIIIQIQGKK